MSSQPLLEPTTGKRIALPVRVEPKVFFANERTFLSWLNFTVVLGGLAMGLLNFGDRISRLSAMLFTVTAMFVMLYALYTFHWRATKIRKREAAPYDDRVGPTVLCIFLIVAVAFNFYRKFLYTVIHLSVILIINISPFNIYSSSPTINYLIYMLPKKKKIFFKNSGHYRQSLSSNNDRGAFPEFLYNAEK